MIGTILGGLALWCVIACAAAIPVQLIAGQFGIRCELLTAWYDLWVGAYWDREKRRLYVFLFPTLGMAFHLPTACQRRGHKWSAENTGGRPCPRGCVTCSQPVYVCTRCGELDYGERGGPGARECADCDWQPEEDTSDHLSAAPEEHYG